MKTNPEIKVDSLADDVTAIVKKFMSLVTIVNDAKASILLLEEKENSLKIKEDRVLKIEDSTKKILKEIKDKEFEIKRRESVISFKENSYESKITALVNAEEVYQEKLKEVADIEKKSAELKNKIKEFEEKEKAFKVQEIMLIKDKEMDRQRKDILDIRENKINERARRLQMEADI